MVYLWVGHNTCANVELLGQPARLLEPCHALSIHACSTCTHCHIFLKSRIDLGDGITLAIGSTHTKEVMWIMMTLFGVRITCAISHDLQLYSRAYRHRASGIPLT